MSEPLERSTPEQQGISSQAILNFIDAVETQLRDLHSFMLLRHGQVVAEGWWSPYAAEFQHVLYSLSKSFTAAAVGLALTEDRLSLDDPLIAFFPEDLPETVSPNLAAMRVRHLLSMSTGHAENTSDRMMESADRNWERAFLAQPVEFSPGTHFVYNNGATYMLAAILHKLTGQSLVEYLTPRLFEPLGIQNPLWETNPYGINVGFKGLKLKTEDIARFGQLYLNKGLWQGRRILPESWVALASARHVENGGGDSPVDWSQGYGFQFWRGQHNSYRGDGAFGQYCLVLPDQDALLAMTGGMDQMQPVLDIVWQQLLPAMQPQALTADPQAAQRLAAKVVCLEIAPPKGMSATGLLDAQPAPDWLEKINGQTYRLEPNYMGVQTLRVHQTAGRLTYETGPYRLECGLESWLPGIAGPFAPLTMEYSITSGLDERAPQIASHRAAASATWTEPGVLVITVRYTETPFVQTITCHFSGDAVAVDARVNVSFGPLEGPRILGKREAAA